MIIANAGIPMLEVIWPAAWLSLAPVIVIEGLLARRMLGIPARRAIGAAAVANLVSTFVGIPLVWGVLATIEVMHFGTGEGMGTTGLQVYAVTVQAPWLVPYMEHLAWMVPVATIVLAPVFYVASVLVEHAVCRFWFGAIPARRRWRWALAANGISYAALTIVALAIGTALASFAEPATAPIVDAVRAAAVR